MFFNNTYQSNQHLSHWLPHWFFHFGGKFVCSLKNYEWSMCGVLYAVCFMICWVLHSVTMKKWIQDCAPQQQQNGTVFTHVIFLEPMPVHQSSSHTCWFLPEMTPGVINLAVSNWLNYLFNLSEIFSQSLLQIFDVVQIGPDFGPDYLWTNLDLHPKAL